MRRPGPTDGAARALGGLAPVLAWLTVTDHRTGTRERTALRSNGAIWRARRAMYWARMVRPWREYRIQYRYGRDAQGDTDSSVR